MFQHRRLTFFSILSGIWLWLAVFMAGCEPAPAAAPITASPTPAQPTTALSSLPPSYHLSALQVDASLLPAYLTVNAILQDSQGWLWFATDHGLYRYDGYDLTLYTPQTEGASSVSSEDVTSLAQGASGSLWIGSGERLDRFDPRTGEFSHFDLDRAFGSPLHVSAILEGPDGHVWVATLENGLYILDPATGQVSPAPAGAQARCQTLSLIQSQDGAVWQSCQDRAGIDRINPRAGSVSHLIPEGDTSGGRLALDADGSLWLATLGDGLFRYFPQDNAWAPYAAGRFSTTAFSFTAVFVDRAGRVWAGTDNQGLFQLDPQTGQIVAFKSNPNNPNSLSSNHVQSLMEDLSGLLWVGLRSGGLDKLDWRAGIQQIRAVHGNPNSLSSNLVNTLYTDSGGTLWIGSQDGLDSMAGGAWVHYQPDSENPNGLAGQDVTAVFADPLGRLWVGTREAGLSCLDPETGVWTHYGTEAGLQGYNLTAITEDRTGTLWVLEAGALYRQDSQGHFQPIFAAGLAPQDGSLPADTFTVMLDDRAGALWLGSTRSGLFRLEEESLQWTHTTLPTAVSSAPNPAVLALQRDQAGQIWVGAQQAGLYRVNPADGSVLHFAQKDGLPGSSVYGILADAQGNLWLSTDAGLVEAQLPASHFTPISTRENNPYTPGAATRSADGELFFGGMNGVTEFYPEDIQPDPYAPPVILTDFQLFYASVVPGQGQPLQQAIGATQSIQLSYRQNVFAFEFAALDYAHPDANQYAYRLQGYDPDWVQAGTRRLAAYTNIPPGEYVFQVKAANASGVWNEAGAEVRITILPPFWQTWPFRLAVAAVLIGLVATAYSLRERVIRRQKQQLEGLVIQRTHELEAALASLQESKEAAEAANRAKSIFLATMSHELRTPLNAILGFARILRRTASLPDQGREALEIIAGSGEHLLALITDILNLSRVESGRMELEEEDFSLPRLMDELAGMLRVEAESKGLSLAVELAPEAPAWVHADRKKLRQTLINLVGNAIKYTQQGSIQVKVWVPEPGQDPQPVWFEVADTGQGISPEEQKTLFQAFSQAQAGREAQDGAGLGLAISQRFVRLMGGEIGVTSQPGQGSAFRFNILARTGTSGQSPGGDAVRWPVDSPLAGMLRDPLAGMLRNGQKADQALIETNLPSMLIVDDDLPSRKLLGQILTSLGAEVQEARDGAGAVAAWQAGHPRVIWMDLRMPRVDGREAVRRIRALPGGDEALIVAVTASAFEEERQDLLAAGFDAVLHKPYTEEQVIEVLASFGIQVAPTATPEPEAAGRRRPEEALPGIPSLSALPDEWRSALKQAAHLADAQAVEEIIVKIEGMDPVTGKALRGLSAGYRYDLIEQALS